MRRVHRTAPLAGAQLIRDPSGHWTAWPALWLLLLAGACDATPQGPPAGQLQISVAPLTLPGLTNACYGLVVTNGRDEVVWQRSGLCADDYGDGIGDLSYVGTCDASDDAAVHDVALTLEGLYQADGLVAPASYANPTVPTPISVPATCLPNADTAVTFDLTVARAATQGFFDVAVEFDDLFCSAKVDCVDSAGAPLALLFDASGQRATTIVSALACTDGSSQDAATHLYRSPLTLRCPAPVGDVVLDPSAGPGNVYATATTDPVFQVAVFEGREALTQAGADMDKLYWNVAIGLDLDQLPAGCRLVGSASASQGALDQGTTPAGATYPVLEIDVPVTDGAGLSCTHHPLNGAPAGVATRYARPDDRAFFANSFNGATSLPIAYEDRDSDDIPDHLDPCIDLTGANAVVLTASEDTYVTEYNAYGGPAAALGGRDFLALIGPSPYRARTLVKFDLSELAGATVVGSTAAVALRLRSNHPNATVTLNGILRTSISPWSEATTTWNNYGNSTSSNIQTRSWWKTATGWISWDLPIAVVQSWIDGSTDNNGLFWYSSVTTLATDVTFYARESGDGYAPTLTLEAQIGTCP